MCSQEDSDEHRYGQTRANDDQIGDVGPGIGAFVEDPEGVVIDGDDLESCAYEGPALLGNDADRDNTREQHRIAEPTTRYLRISKR